MWLKTRANTWLLDHSRRRGLSFNVWFRRSRDEESNSVCNALRVDDAQRESGGGLNEMLSATSPAIEATSFFRWQPFEISEESSSRSQTAPHKGEFMRKQRGGSDGEPRVKGWGPRRDFGVPEKSRGQTTSVDVGSHFPPMFRGIFLVSSKRESSLRHSVCSSCPLHLVPSP